MRHSRPQSHRQRSRLCPSGTAVTGGASGSAVGAVSQRIGCWHLWAGGGSGARWTQGTATRARRRNAPRTRQPTRGGRAPKRSLHPRPAARRSEPGPQPGPSPGRWLRCRYRSTGWRRLRRPRTPPQSASPALWQARLGIRPGRGRLQETGSTSGWSLQLQARHPTRSWPGPERIRWRRRLGRRSRRSARARSISAGDGPASSRSSSPPHRSATRQCAPLCVTHPTPIGAPWPP